MVNVYRDPAKTAADSPYAEPTPALTPEGAAARRYPAGSAEARAQNEGERQLKYDVVAYGTSVEERARAVEASRRASVVGTPDWYAYQIVARDAQARETTVSKPGQANLSRPTSEQAIVTAISTRPRGMDAAQFGDRKTQQLLSAVPEGDRTAALGVILEQQRREATKTPTLTDDRFFQNQLNLWNAQAIEGSAGEHAYKKSSPNPADWTANVRENLGDIALVVEKAGNPKDNFGKNYAFNPNVGSVMSVLPQRTNADGTVTPVGLQEYAWMGAVSGKSPGNVSWMPAINYINSQRGRQGIYGNLAGGVPDEFTPLPAGYSNGGMIHQPTIAAPDRLIGSGKVGGLGVVSDRKEGFTYTPIGKTLPTSGNQPPMIPNTFSRSEDWIGNLPVFGWIFGMIPGAVDLQTAVLPTSKAEGIPFLGNIARDASRPLMTEYTSEIKPSALSVMAGGKEDFQVKMSTTAKGYETAPWIPSKGTTYTGGSPELTEMEKHITAEQIGISAGQANIASLGKGNISGGYWTGSQASFETYNQQAGALEQRINKYNATLPQYDALAKANPIYATKYDMSKGVLVTGKTSVIGDTQFRSFEKGLIAETYGKVLPEHINLQSSTGKPLPLDTPMGLGYVAMGADYAYGYTRDNPFDILGMLAFGAGVQYSMGLPPIGIAKAATSNVPIISTLGRAGSTPLAADVGMLVKGGVGAFFVASAGMNVMDQPTTEGKIKTAAETGVQFGAFALGMSMVPEPMAPINPYKGKTFFTGERSFSPLQKAGMDIRTYATSFEVPKNLRKVYREIPKAYREVRFQEPRPGITEKTPSTGFREPDISIAKTIGVERAGAVRDAIAEQSQHAVLGSTVMETQKSGLPTGELIRSSGNIHDLDVRVANVDILEQSLIKRGETLAGIDAKPFEMGHPLAEGVGSNEGIQRIGLLTRIFGEPISNEPGMKLPYREEVKMGGVDYAGVLNQEQYNVQFARKSQAFMQDLVPAEGKIGNVEARALNEQFRLPKDYYDFQSMGKDIIGGTQAAKLQAGGKVPIGAETPATKFFKKIEPTEIKFDFLPFEDNPIIGAKAGTPFKKTMTFGEIRIATEEAIINARKTGGQTPEYLQPAPPSTRPYTSGMSRSVIGAITSSPIVIPITPIKGLPKVVISPPAGVPSGGSTLIGPSPSIISPSPIVSPSLIPSGPSTIKASSASPSISLVPSSGISKYPSAPSISKGSSLTKSPTSSYIPKTTPPVSRISTTPTLPSYSPPGSPKSQPYKSPPNRPPYSSITTYTPPPPPPPSFPFTSPSLKGSGRPTIRGARFRKYTEVMMPMRVSMPRMPKITLPGKPRLKVVKKKRKRRLW